jgi:multidrug efflux pump subunit AcrB
VLTAVNAQNIILPTGTVKLGQTEYNVGLNSSPEVVDELNNLPVKTVNGTVIYMRDVAHVRDGFQVQTNVVRQDGRRGSLLSVYKTGNASTLDIVRLVREALPSIAATLPPQLRIQPLVSQILNFGISAPIDVQFVGNDVMRNLAIAQKVEARIREIPGAVDTYIYQLFNQPRLDLDVDRSKASQSGLTERDVANSLLVALSSSAQVSPTYWLNPMNGVTYSLAVQAPQYRIESLQNLYELPIRGSNPTNQLLVNLATFERAKEAAVVSHYNVQPVVDVYASVQGRDLGGVAAQVGKIVQEAKGELPRGSHAVIRGQVETMHSSFVGLGAGLAFAVVLVYLLMVVNFQSWLDPFIIITALPGALAGISWMLFVTGTTLSVPALMGAIMCIGVATANSILVVTFARERLAGHGGAFRAALEAGVTRLRPVLMTALAMIIGMVPMSLGLGEGGEQNAPLGRAVIGGLLLATLATLFFVPAIFSLIHGRRRAASKPRRTLMMQPA